jgi:threonine aldolase
LLRSRGFASDNNAGIHPKVLSAIKQVNQDHVIAYGDDLYTEKAIQHFKNQFGKDIEVYFVFNGTAANVLGLKAITHSFNSIICTDIAHLNMDECGAPENFTGCKLLTIPTTDGKLTIEGIQKYLYGFGFEHHAQPKAVSITQATEMGTVYSIAEIEKISQIVHKYNLRIHMDGARLANAAAFLGNNLKEMTVDAGVDVLSFGGTKNGIMLGEAIIFFNPDLANNFKYIRKQGMQLGSKMRFVSAQFSALFRDNLWLKNAQHANQMARYLADQVENIPEIQITQPVQANGIFAIVPKKYIPQLQKEFFFYVWNEETSEVRWMTSFDTQPEDIDEFVTVIKKTLQKSK